MDRPLILASGSRGRRELLQRAGYTFTVDPANLDEPTEAEAGNIADYVAHLAWRKAQAVAHRHPHAVILAADTVGWIHGHVVGKPDDEAHARRILQELSGTVHELWTGVCLWSQPEGMQLLWQEVSQVEMVPLSPEQIETYLQTRQWVGCSGAYAIQMPEDPFLRVVSGSTTNVIGLPMESLAQRLEPWLELCRQSASDPVVRSQP